MKYLVGLLLCLLSVAAQAQQVPHPVNGPAASVVDEFPIWGHTLGQSLKSALNTVVKHTGGYQTIDTGTPPVGYAMSSSPAYSSFVNKTFNLFESNHAANHIGQFWSTVAIKNNSLGSGQNGPGHDDFALTLTCDRTNYLTTTQQGEAGCLWSAQTHGAKGDASNLLASIARVDDPTVPNYGSTAVETDIEHVAPTTGASILRGHYSVGFGVTGFQQITGVAAGAGGVCRLTVQNTAPFDAVTGSVGMTVTGIRGSTECNGQWGTINKIDGTHIDLVNSKFVNAYVAGGAAGTPPFALGGPATGFEARSQTGQHGTAFLATRATQPNAGSWGSAMKVRLENEYAVAFDMSANSGKFIVQPPTLPSLLDENFSASFLGGAPIRWAGNTVGMPKDNPTFPWSTYPGGGALGYNFSGGSGEINMWNLLPTAAATFALFQKLSATTQKLMFNVSDSGSTFYTPLEADSMVIGAATGGPTAGTINVAVGYRINGASGITCGPGSPTASFQVIGGLVVAC